MWFILLKPTKLLGRLLKNRREKERESGRERESEGEREREKERQREEERVMEGEREKPRERERERTDVQSPPPRLQLHPPAKAFELCVSVAGCGGDRLSQGLRVLFSARPVYHNYLDDKVVRKSSLSMKNSLSLCSPQFLLLLYYSRPRVE